MTDKYNITKEDQQKILDARDFGFETANILNKALKEISANASNESVDVQQDWEWKLKFITQTFHSSKKSAQSSIIKIGKYMLYLSRQSGREDEQQKVIDNAIKVDEWSNMSDAAKRQIINSVKEKYVTTYREIMFSGDLSVPAQIMKVKELKGDFETPEDKEEY